MRLFSTTRMLDPREGKREAISFLSQLRSRFPMENYSLYQFAEMCDLRKKIDTFFHTFFSLMWSLDLFIIHIETVYMCIRKNLHSVNVSSKHASREKIFIHFVDIFSLFCTTFCLKTRESYEKKAQPRQAA